ncbi:hypothetical protein [Spirosoma linguale]|uniref:Glycin-rich signal peptide protein n=1 Tax=Spirosoma linguale (strain ATCC 33905 / DSM 74 / LMG 10896 / Claus 1) TaxID=504472 RepID=D2QDX2_SPILD|nr:glycin-rich signal peptide protein [Spirosoma linguale DSM 74]
MKTIILSFALTLLIGVASVSAQTAGGKYGGNRSNAGRQGNSSLNNARKANTSQTMGNGVPYNKDAEQKRAIASGSTSTTGGPTVNRGQSASASAPATAKRNNASGSKSGQGGKAGAKSGSTTPKGSGNQ